MVLKCYLSQYFNRKVNFHLFKYKDHCQKFIEKYDNDNITWKIHENIEELFKCADIIISFTKKKIL